MIDAFKITLGVMLGIGVSLFAIVFVVLMLNVAVIAAFTVYHLMHA